MARNKKIIIFQRSFQKFRTMEIIKKPRKIKLIAILTLSAFVLSLAVPMVSAIGNQEGSTSGASGAALHASVVNNLQNSLAQLRRDKENFLNSKLQEAAENASALKEKIVSKRREIQNRIEAIKKVREEKRKVVLLRLIHIQVKQFENTKERVAKMPNISADLKAELNGKIDTAIDELKAEIIIGSGLSSVDDLKAFAKELKSLFKEKREIVKDIVDAILASRVDKAIDTAENRLAELKVKIDALKASGQNTAELDNLLAVAESKIAAAGAKAGKKELKAAISDLKEAYKNMKKALEKAEDFESVK